MRPDVLVVLAAPLRGDGLPRRSLQPLADRALLSRIIDVASDVVASRDQLLVVADDDEVALLAERSGCRVVMEAAVAASTLRDLGKILEHAVEAIETERGAAFSAVLLLNAVSPLLKSATLEGAVEMLSEGGLGAVASASAITETPGSGRSIPGSIRPTDLFLVLRRSVPSDGEPSAEQTGIMVVAADEAVEIRSQHDWWICERLLHRRRIVFVVIGYPAVGLGHVYRSTLIAHELMDHELHFVCMRGSDLAAVQLAAQGFTVHEQRGEDLEGLVLGLHPDLVINDMLNTDRDYVCRLRRSGARVVNFEDLGPGAEEADLVVNDIFMQAGAASNRLNGPDYFCIRDEFLHATPRRFQDTVKEILITFGGVDAGDMTSRVGHLVLPMTHDRGIRVSFVTGPGYAHLERLRRFLAGVPPERAELANGTKRMSEYMARADVAFSSAGRTVFELAAMRVPGIILAANEREESHTFASEENGFVYLGRSDLVSDASITSALARLLDSPEERRALRDRMACWDFRFGRQRVRAAVVSFLGQ